ncbi:MAG: CRISPR-associated endonuclease Cas2 [Methanosphaera stadtmanae]|nr:CRISPR-associated endonuclease Cas2 [Methanosphaera stadtmanae]
MKYNTIKLLIITKIKFLQQQEKINNILITYSFKQIDNNIHLSELSQTEFDELKKELKEIIKEKDNIIFIPICKGCYKNIIQIGNKINFKEEKYVIL